MTFPSLFLAFFLLTSSFSPLAAGSSAAYPIIPGTVDTSVSAAPSDDLIPVRREVYTSDMPVWESDDGLGQFLWLPKSMKNGSLANNSEMKLPTHTGTHVDAPGHVFDHYFDAGFDVDTLDLEVLNGVDYLSVAAWTDLIPSHLVFLDSREIILVEALKLDGIKPGIYSVHCLPLRLIRAEGSPIRCILMK
ncbi:unnamed protein product [Linum tenue]|uniref:Uncharacterized protein n=1 Tax=Linum tenue TaxID=586396 RepID=A0AAV0MJS4_9ROSI|nr:unnamed protein product [Linum tenue]CAI0445813.1 unnamed protein product [Linum tenue]